MNELQNLAGLSDHDIIILLYSEVKALKELVQKGSEGSKLTLDDHEVRLRKMEQQVWKWSGVSGLVGATASLVVEYFFTHRG